MQLRRIEIRDFRKLSHVVVEDLQDGLNILVGDNEAGKSTLLAALRAGLFERHRVGGDVAAGMLPYGQSVRPEISIDFDLNGKHWRLKKAFCQRPEAELVGPGERAIGDAVEDRLAELFGFTPPGKGRSKPEEHQGIYGLLWVEQGGSYRSLGVGAGRDTIASALELEVGQVVGGERGRALLSAADDRRNGFWDKRNNPKGPYKALLDEVAGLETRRTELASSLAAYDEKISVLAMKNDALMRHGREDRLSKAVQSLTAAKEAVEHSRQLAAVLTSTVDKLKRSRLDQEIATERKAARDQLIAAVKQTEKAMVDAEFNAEEGRGTLSKLEAAAEAGESRLRKLFGLHQEADERVRALEHIRAHRQAAALLANLEAQLRTVDAADVKRREYLTKAEGVSIRREDVTALEKLQSENDRARLQLEAASVRIAFEIDGAKSVTVDGELQDTSAALRLSRDVVMDLEDFGRLRIHPGGGVDALARAADKTAQALADRLATLGFVDINAARDSLGQRNSAAQEAAALDKTIAMLAPKGLDALKQEVVNQRVIAARPLTAAASAISDASDAMFDETSRALHEAREELLAVETAATTARRAKDDAGRNLATLTERAASMLRRHEASLQELAAARHQVSDDDLEHRLSSVALSTESAESELATAQAAVDAAEPEAIALELQRAEGAERSIRVDIEKLGREKRDLEIELKALGRDGLGEQLTEVEDQIPESRKRLAARHREAAASRLLYDALSQAQRETKDRWLGPVRERVKPYLRLIQPDTDIVLNEDTLEIEHFVRKGVSEPFQSLSVGAREQIAVITRLALADILRASGQPSAIILDDALVNTDEGRLERMHLVLHKAAQALQVLVLTCRERDFLQLGAPIRRL